MILFPEGTGSGDVNEAYTVSLVEGLSNSGYTLDESLKNSYAAYIADVKAKRPKPRNFFDNPPRSGNGIEGRSPGAKSK